jgi:diaminopimelate decarboxylase
MAIAATQQAVDFPTLPAQRSARVRQVLRSALLEELSHGLGGPFHILLPDTFDANVAAFESVLADGCIDAAIYYAKKANKAACWIERSARNDTGVDVASVGELREALAHGVRGTNLVVTGPAKSDALLSIAILQDCLIAVDALDELDRVIALAGSLRPARILLRCLPPDQPGSRFGLDDDEIATALRRCIGATSVLEMAGFSFHLSGYQIQARADLAGQLIERCLLARAWGLRADRLSIGGGFAVDYVDASDWHRFTCDQRAEHFHAGKTFGDFYPYHSPIAGARALRAVLAARPAGGHGSLTTMLRSSETTLLVEPGRALLDQAGFTVFRVQGVKARDYGIVNVDGTSLSLSEQWFNSEFLPEPVLLPETTAGSDGPFPACVGGASCLDSDMLSWRKIPFPRQPKVGDLLAYLNTAGYQMDSNESTFHEAPLPPRVVLESDGDRIRWRLDRHAQ